MFLPPPPVFTKYDVYHIAASVIRAMFSLQIQISDSDLNTLIETAASRQIQAPTDTSELNILAEQVDALVDIAYYIYNAFAKCGCLHLGGGGGGNDIDKRMLMVRDFTLMSGFDIPYESRNLDNTEKVHILRMVMDELVELFDTVCDGSTEVESYLKHIASINYLGGKWTVKDAIDQFEVHLRNRNMDFDEVFKLVHKANMAKRDPKTGVFILRESDRKVMKPAGWTPPDVKGEVKRQLENPPVFYAAAPQQQLFGENLFPRF